MRVIKFSLDFGWNLIDTATHCEPLWIEYQNDEFVVWCKEYTVLPATQPVELLLVVTGEQVPDNLTYIGTATTPDRQFVAHLFKP